MTYGNILGVQSAREYKQLRQKVVFVVQVSYLNSISNLNSPKGRCDSYPSSRASGDRHEFRVTQLVTNHLQFSQCYQGCHLHNVSDGVPAVWDRHGLCEMF